MKKYLLFLAVLFTAMTAKAYDITYAGCYKSVKLEFQSIDENNQPITLSELVTIPLQRDGVTNREVGFFVLCSMPFTIKEEKTSTGDSPLDGVVLRTIATEGAMVVQVDGQGFGSSSGKTIPFLVNKLNARQSIDGLFAAMDYASKNGIQISDDYYTINTGYSLAGGRAVAVQRYLEKYSTADEKARFRLKQTICGGAPINATETAYHILNHSVTDLEKYHSLFEGFMDANRQGSLHAFTKADLYDGNGTIKQEVLEGFSPIGRAFWKAIAQQDMNEDWTPETPIKDVHFADDEIVTYKNAEVALDSWGKDKFQIVDRQMTGMKWNLSMLRPVSEAMRTFSENGSHVIGASNFYTGMVDGCLRDTVIPSMYGKPMNYNKMLTALFDISSGLNEDIDINIPTSIPNGKLIIKTLGYCHFTGEIYDEDGKAIGDVNVTLKPEVQDFYHSCITDVDANGYLHLPLEFNVELYDVIGSINIDLGGSCTDLYQFVENLSAIVLHRKCADESTAEKYCDALNSTIDIYAKILGKKLPVYAWYQKQGDYYVIMPFSKLKILFITKEKPLADWLDDLADLDITPYLTIDNQNFKVDDYEVRFHVAEEEFGELKIYADILKSDSTVFGRVDFDITGVDMNDDGTRQTFNINFTVKLNDIPLKVTGTCSNVNDAVLSAILCCGNLSLPTEYEAQAYADAVNSNINMELYVEKVGDDGEYHDLGYIDYGPVYATVTQDSLGAYYVQYCLNWMGKKNVPLMTIIKELIK